MKNYEIEDKDTCKSYINSRRSLQDIKKVYDILNEHFPSFCCSCIIDSDGEHGLVRIRMPYKDSNGKRIAMYCNIGINDDFLFTDDGYFVEELEKIGISRFINSPLTIHIKNSDNFTRCFDFYLNIFRRMNSIINRSNEESFHLLSEQLEDKCIKLSKELVDSKKYCHQVYETAKSEVKSRDHTIKALEKELQNLKKKKKIYRIKPLSKRAIHIEFNGYEKRQGVIRYSKMPCHIVDMDLPQSQINRSFICPDTGNLCLGHLELFLTPDQLWYILFEKDN